VFTYIISLALIFGMSLVVDYLAPTFLGKSDPFKAFKLVAYSSTAAMVAGIFMLLPALSVLAVLGGFYSLYLFYVGVPVLMKCPPEKQLPYTAVMVAMGLVVGLIFMILANILGPSGARIAGAPNVNGNLSINTPGGKVSVDLSAMEAAGKQMEAATKKMEAAQKSGDAEATAKATGEAMAAMTGALGGMGAAGGGREPIPVADLKALMPETLGALKRESFASSGGTAMGVKNSNMEASFVGGDANVQVKVQDLGSLAGLAALAAIASMEGEKEDASSKERTYKSGSRMIKERVAKDGKSAQIEVFLKNGVIVEARGNGVGLDAVKQAAESVNLAKLESYGAK
jgi:hypothetical protein